METRAYLTHDSETVLRVTVHTDCALYSKGDADPDQSWTFPAVDDGKAHTFGSQPDQPFEDADRILADHGWKREGRWLVGTRAHARICRAS